MTAPITLPPLETAPLAELHRRYETTPNVESRTRYQMLLLAQQDFKVPQIARIEWLWRISRRLVTHNHHRSDFESLLADARTHFETLTHTPDDLLRHIGSPFAPDKRSTQSQELAA